VSSAKANFCSANFANLLRKLNSNCHLKLSRTSLTTTVFSTENKGFPTQLQVAAVGFGNSILHTVSAPAPDLSANVLLTINSIKHVVESGSSERVHLKGCEPIHHQLSHLPVPGCKWLLSSVFPNTSLPAA
jgi:hypothetical protein